VLPPPESLPVEAWHVFAVFVGVVLGFLLRPLEMAPIVLLGLLTLFLTHGWKDSPTESLKLKSMVASGFGDRTVWLVVFAFLIADAVEATGLGRRLALLLLAKLGRSLIGLAYAVSLTDLFLAPFLPSNTARGGGIVSPIVQSLARSIGSDPVKSPRRGGAYLVQVGAHANLVTSAMFLTAMAGNAQIPVVAETFLGRTFDFRTWATGAVVPGLVALALVPWVVHWLERPEKVDVSSARRDVRKKLSEMGATSAREWRLAGLLLTLLATWTLQGQYGTTTIALAGVLSLVLLGIRSWQDLTHCSRAWDALLWLGGFVALAKSLKTTGFTTWFAEAMRVQFDGADPIVAALLLAIVYYLSMYLFSQLTAHIVALAGTFFAIAMHLGAPPQLILALIAYFSCLCGTTTPWSTGPLIIYFGQGYVSVGRWMRNGLAMTVFQMSLWLTVGMAWWKFLGWW